MEAARLTAGLGHRVTLLEKQHRLGGSLLLASTLHRDNEYFLNFLIAEVSRLPITLRFGFEASVESITALRPDHIIVATGARVAIPDIPGSHLPLVTTGARMRSQLNKLPGLIQRLIIPSLLRRASRAWMPIGQRVVIIGTDLAAVELAEFLAARGRRVHLVGEGERITPEVGKKRRAEHMDRLDRLKVTVNTAIRVREIRSNGLVLQSVTGCDKLLAADQVIIAGEAQADTGLADALSGAGWPAVAIGDCSGLGLIAGATRDAADAVARISSPMGASP